MTEDEAKDNAKEILQKSRLTEDDINRFYDLEPYLQDYQFGALVEALVAITPPELMQFV